MDINKRIFEVLDEKGISQKELSKRTGISESTISDWKRKGKTPGIDKLILLCEKLNVDIYSLAGIDYEYQLDDDEKLVIDMYRSTDPGSRKRLLAYIKSFENISSLPLINDNSLDNNRYNKNVDSNEIFQPDQFFYNKN